jgi:hypothetical protein
VPVPSTPTPGLGQNREFWWDTLARLILKPGTLPGTLELCLNGHAHQWELGDTAHYSEGSARQYGSWTTAQDPPTARHALYLSLWRLLQPLQEDERGSVVSALNAWAGTPPAGPSMCRTMTLQEVHSLAQGV